MKRPLLLAATALPYLVYGAVLWIDRQTHTGGETTLGFALMWALVLSFAVFLGALAFQAVAVLSGRRATRHDRVLLLVMALVPFLFALSG